MKRLSKHLVAIVFVFVGIFLCSNKTFAAGFANTITIDGTVLTEENQNEFPTVQYISGAATDKFTVEDASFTSLSIELGSSTEKLEINFKGANIISGTTIFDLKGGEISINSDGSLKTNALQVKNTGGNVSTGKFIIKKGTLNTTTNFVINDTNLVFNSGNFDVSNITGSDSNITIDAGKFTASSSIVLQNVNLLISGGEVTIGKTTTEGLKITNGTFTVNNGVVNLKGQTYAAYITGSAAQTIILGDGMYVVEDVTVKNGTFVDKNNTPVKSITLKQLGGAETNNSKTADNVSIFIVIILVSAGALLLKSRRTSRL